MAPRGNLRIRKWIGNSALIQSEEDTILNLKSFVEATEETTGVSAKLVVDMWSRQSFLTNALIPLPHKPYSHKFISCSYSQHEPDSPRKKENKLAELALVAVAAGVLTLGSVHDASAAKSGGRVGGQAFRSPAPRSSPRINNNSRTNIYVNPPVAPPLVGGYGYGYGYGGWGWSPFSFFAPGPSVAVGIGGGFDTIVLFLVLGAATAVVRRFFRSRDEEEDDY